MILRHRKNHFRIIIALAIVLPIFFVLLIISRNRLVGDSLKDLSGLPKTEAKP
jgi:hypothetical protein